MKTIDNTPCPCILWSMSGRDPQEFHNARAQIEADCKRHQWSKRPGSTVAYCIKCKAIKK